jgi:hypothetical protein
MSRNIILAIVGILIVFLALIFFSQRGTNTQSGIISPTPAGETVTVTEEPTVEVSPTTEVTLSPTTVPTVQVTVSP